MANDGLIDRIRCAVLWLLQLSGYLGQYHVRYFLRCVSCSAVLETQCTFLLLAAKAYPYGGEACELNFQALGYTWQNYDWACYPRECNSDDIGRIEE